MELNNSIHILQTGDLTGVATVHLAAFPRSALTLLGRETVRRYYEWQLTGPHQVTALGIAAGKTLVGFCFGGRFQGSLAGFLRKNRGYLLWRALTHFWLLADPVFRIRAGDGVKILKRFTRPKTTLVASTAAPPTLSFGILSIAVHPGYQGQGFGKRLMVEAEAAARRCGYAEMNLTVEIHNHLAIAFYESSGWEKHPIHGIWNGKMKKNLLKGNL